MTSNMTMMTRLTASWAAAPTAQPRAPMTGPPMSAPLAAPPDPVAGESPPGAARAWGIAARVRAPHHPHHTIADLGILRDVVQYDQGDVHVQICSEGQRERSVEVIRDCLVRALTEEGFRHVDV